MFLRFINFCFDFHIFFIRLAEVKTNSSATVYVSASNKKGQFLDVNALRVNSTLSTSVQTALY